MAMPSIKTRLMLSYITIVFVTIFILDCFLIFSIRNYYLDNITEILAKQAEVSGNFYEKYINSKDINYDATILVDTFAGNTNAQIQIIDPKFQLIADSTGTNNMLTVDYPDVKEALKGDLGIWKGKAPVSKEPILSVAYPLKNNKQIIGTIRLITSLTSVYAALKSAIFIIIAFSIAVLIIATFMSLFIASTITNPIKNMIKAAKRMAQGNFQPKIKKYYDDEIGELSETLNYMADEILKQEKLKDEFIASISHELRTPLTSINGWAITLSRQERIEQSQIKYGLKIIEEESLRLKALVDELLDFSSLAAGRINLKFEYFELNELINHILFQMQPRAERQHINLTKKLSSEIELIHADPNRLKQVLINVLDNALKFTPPEGAIKISTAILHENLQIIIEDSGCGIPQDDLEKIKLRFYKGKQEAGGSGLGLAVCEEIIKLHQGQLHIESTVNAGTTVTIILPL